MLISISQIIDTELVLLGPAQRSKASLVSILLGRTSKNLNKCIESLTFLLLACVTVIDSKAPIFCAMIDRMFRCQAKGFFYVFIYNFK